QDGSGVLDRSGSFRYVALGMGDRTLVQVIAAKRGLVSRWTVYPGTWGTPQITQTWPSGGGLSADGKTLVLGSTRYASTSRFLVVSTKTLRTKSRVVLHGNFTFDALSPDASRLYLIQYTTAQDLSHYIVRAYDLDHDRLLPGRVADKTQKDWTMQGYPISRVTSASGRWVYTLYSNPGGGRPPFVHALDTVNGVAHCIGFRFDGDQSKLWQAALSLRDGGRMLSIRMRGGDPWLAIDTSSWRIAHPEELEAVATERSSGGIS